MREKGRFCVKTIKKNEQMPQKIKIVIKLVKFVIDRRRGGVI